MKEVEILSGISPEKFNVKVEEFTKKFGEPKVQKRFGIIFGNYSKGNEIDTRIKITNGVPHIIQKVGEGLSASRTNTEFDLILKNNKAEDILMLIRMLQKIGNHDSGFTSPVQQYDNLLFSTPDMEIKMYRQFNSKNMFYGFEVELLNLQSDIHDVCDDLGLELDGVDRDATYWYEYDQKYNADGLQMSDEELLIILSKYLKQ